MRSLNKRICPLCGEIVGHRDQQLACYCDDERSDEERVEDNADDIQDWKEIQKEAGYDE